MGKAIYGILVLSLTTSAFLSQTQLFEGVMNQIHQIDSMMRWAGQKVQEVDGIKETSEPEFGLQTKEGNF